jgi:site-specific recombinase XerD
MTGKLFDKKFMTRTWSKVKSLAELPPDLQLYSLRHNFASWLIMQGTDLLTVAKLMGHKDIKMIVDHYGHLQPQTLEKSVSNAFASMFAEEAPKSESLNG